MLLVLKKTVVVAVAVTEGNVGKGVVRLGGLGVGVVASPAFGILLLDKLDILHLTRATASPAAPTTSLTSTSSTSALHECAIEILDGDIRS